MLPLQSDEYADGTDGRTGDRYITLSARRRERKKIDLKTTFWGLSIVCERILLL